MESAEPELANAQLEHEPAADAKRKKKKRRRDEKKRNRVAQPPPLHEEWQPLYKTLVNHRRLFTAYSVLQVPEVVLKMQVGQPRKRLKTRGSQDKRKRYRESIKDRGIPLPEALHFRYYSLEELVSAFVAATPEKECLTDLHQAAQHEMMYTIEQGINSRSLVAADACMTLKQLFLFCWEMKWSEQRRIEYWRNNIELAVVSGPGLFVHEVFHGDKKLSEQALEWMMQFDRNQPFSPTHCFMQPRYANQPRVDGGDESGVSEEEGVGGDEESSHSGVAQEDEEGEGGDEERSRDIVPRSRRHGRLEVEHGANMVQKLVAHLVGMNTIEEVVQGVKYFDPLVQDVCPSLASSEIDTGVLISCVNILRTRHAALEYIEKLPLLRKYVIEEEDEEEEEDTDEETEEQTQEGPSKALPSVKVNIARLVDKSERKDSCELQHLKKYGFFVTECVPFWLISIAEALAKLPERKFVPLFKKAGSKSYYKRWDVKRRISYLVPDDPLYDLITEPVKRMMEGFGLLDVWGEDGVARVVGDCAALKSLPRPAKKAVVQGMHADTPPNVDRGDKLSFSTITAGTQWSALEIYPMSWNGGMGVSKVPVRVEVPPGNTIVFHGVARHRGVSFPLGSLRFFMNFLVKVAAQAVVETTSVLEKWQVQEKDAISFEAWKKLYEG